MYTYKDYQNTRDTAWRVLIDADARSLPVSISAICAGMGIKTITYAVGADVIRSHGLDPLRASGDGFCMPGIIFFDDTTSPGRQRFTVAHELGHIILGHVGQQGLYNREPDPHDDPRETAANGFAARLLAPACVLWGCRAQTADDIMRLCNISRGAAEFRMERLRVLYARDKFLASPLERQVFAMFGNYIMENRL